MHAEDAFARPYQGCAVELERRRLSLNAEGHWLPATLHQGPAPRALVLLPGCGESKVPASLADLLGLLPTQGLAALTLHLLSATESERNPDAAYNIPQLARRILAAAEWVRHQPDLAACPVLLVTSGTACAAAIRAAWHEPENFRALVCFNGRADLAGAVPLAGLLTPTRLILLPGESDYELAQRSWPAFGPGHELLDCSGPAARQCGSRQALAWLLRHLPEDHLPDPAGEHAH